MSQLTRILRTGTLALGLAGCSGEVPVDRTVSVVPTSSTATVTLEVSDSDFLGEKTRTINCTFAATPEGLLGRPLSYSSVIPEDYKFPFDMMKYCRRVAEQWPQVPQGMRNDLAYGHEVTTTPGKHF